MIDWIEAGAGCIGGWQLLVCAETQMDCCKRLMDNVVVLAKQQIRREMEPCDKYVPDDGGSYKPLSQLANRYEVAETEWKRAV